MPSHLSDRGEDTTVYFTMVTSNGDGAMTDLSGTPAQSDFKVYKNGSLMTLDASTITISKPASTTGIYKVSVDQSNDTDFTTNAFYELVFDPATITLDSQSAGQNVGSWDCANTILQYLVENLGTDGAAAINIPWNSSWDAEVQSEVNDGLVALGLDHLVSAAVVGADVTDNSIIARMVSSSATADWDSFANTTDSLQALRDRGDAAWTTGGGGSITDIISWQPLVPTAIDLANTKSYRLGIATTNQLDDLPTAAEITPGTISIDRAAQGGTTWSAVVTDAAMSESDGLIYYDEVFDTATGYAAGDVLRITFKGQIVTVAANDYNITPSGGQIFYTGIIAVNPDVNIAEISGSSAAADALELFALAVDQGTGQLDSGSFGTGAITAASIADGALIASKLGTDAITAAKIATDAISADGLAADAVTEIQSGLATSSALATVDSNVDAILVDTGTTLPATLGTPAGVSMSADIAAVQTTADAVETDTQNIQGRIPTALSSNGNIVADMQEINNVLVTGNGGVGTEFSV